MQTFGMERWELNPRPLSSPLVLALYGWALTDPSSSAPHCAECGNALPPRRSESSQIWSVRLQTTHAGSCVWRAHRCDPGPLLAPGAHQLVSALHTRLASFEEELDPVSISAPADFPMNAVVEALGQPEWRSVVAMCGWELMGPRIIGCDECGRRQLLQPAVDVMAHRPYCGWRQSLSYRMALVQALPPSSLASPEPEGNASRNSNDAPPRWLWLARLVAGLPTE